MLNLRDLKLGNNVIIDSPNFCSEHDNESAFPWLSKLSLSNNRISKLEHFRCLRRLKCLTLDSNPIGVIHSDTFTELKKMKELNIRTVSGPLVIIEERAFDISSLKQLSLRECHFHINRLCTMHLSKLFSSCKSLESLDLAGNNINSTNLTQMLFPLTKLKILSIEATRLSNLPEFIFSNMQISSS